MGVEGKEFFSEPQIGLVVVVFMIITIIVTAARSIRSKVEAAQRRRAADRGSGVKRTLGARARDRCTEAGYLIGKAIFYMYLFTIGLFFIISNIKAMRQLREQFSPWTGDVENEWGYGQVLALAFVLMPTLEFVAACIRKLSFALSSYKFKRPLPPRNAGALPS